VRGVRKGAISDKWFNLVRTETSRKLSKLGFIQSTCILRGKGKSGFNYQIRVPGSGRAAKVFFDEEEIE